MKKQYITGFIYQIRNIINNKRYIGSTVNADQRYKWHKYSLNAGAHHSVALQNAWNKYGQNNFVFEILREIPFCDLLLEEQKEINKYILGIDIYNCNPLAISPPIQRGEKCYNAKLTKNLTKEIRNKYIDNEQITQAALAVEYKISQSVIGNILQNKSWHDPEYIPPIDSKKRIYKNKVNGEKHHNARLTDFQVKEIRKKYHDENITMKQLAIEYEICFNSIFNILQNKSYIDPNYVSHYDSKEKRNLKLNWDMVRQIRKEQKEFKTSHKILAEKYGITRQTVLKIVNNKTWKED